MKSINPVNNETIQEFTPYRFEEVDAIIKDCHQCFETWKARPIQERCELVRKVGNELLAQKVSLAEIMTLEMGKPIGESLAEIEKCASNCEYYANHAAEFLKDQEIKTEAQRSYISFRPMGVILAVMPWNFPFWQVIRFAAPALCAGNTVVLKHASNVTGCSLALEKIFKDAGLPQNAFRSLLISSDVVEKVIKHPLVRAVTLTGSTVAGKSVAKFAGEVLKKTVLELGGSDAYIVLEDAELDHAARALVAGRLLNAGQSCISAKRLIVMSSVLEAFQKKVLQEMKQYTPSDPLDKKTKMGPMARIDLRDQVHEQVQKSLSLGAHCVTGGEKGKGAYYSPTLLTNVKPGMPAFDEEIFGPVVVIVEAKTEEEAIRLANQSQYGLGGGVFSQNLERARLIAEEKLESGGAFVNDFLKSDPRLPFGGIKESGYGRELSLLGIREFVNAKTIVIKKSPDNSGHQHQTE
jgi:succinate-semialdehyde dehydrogenase/glutarate-semialdehyde dehydrogenase